jgi:2-oxoglutarate ferredoxin oxidoreductase subunit alpha
MVAKNHKIIELDQVVVKFAGDSGDGMQLTGTQFSDTSAFIGNDLATFPDFPSEIRAPQGTVAGVSGFQVHVGHADIHTSGDEADVLVAMNPAALKYNLHHCKPSSIIIIDVDSFNEKGIKKAGYETDPLKDGSLDGFKVIKAPITSMVRETLKETGLDSKTIDKSRNQFVAGMLYYMFNRDINIGIEFLKNKFAKKPALVESNVKVLKAGYYYADTIEELATTYVIKPNLNKKGKYRNMTGNQATAWGLMAASERSGLPLFLGSYPITPATNILEELAKHKELGVKTFQAEDEIGGVISSIGASYAGHLAATSTSGPGLSLKSEALGLAVMTELPLVVVNVMRGGPSTGLPTKTEQTDLMQALFGRNGEAPIPVIAASSPADCFDYAFEASRIAVERMTPVILLTDSYLANGSELWHIPDIEKLPEIKPDIVEPNDDSYLPYKRDPKTLARRWAIPGTPGNEHRVGGLEKSDGKGAVSHDPINHEKMVHYRAEKVARVADMYPEQEVEGKEKGKLLVVGWGGTKGGLYTAFSDLYEKGADIAFTHFNYIFPLPKETEEIFSRYETILVCELNSGQFANYLRMNFPQFNYQQFNKVQAQPFLVSELKDKFNEMLEA